LEGLSKSDIDYILIGGLAVDVCGYSRVKKNKKKKSQAEKLNDIQGANSEKGQWPSFIKGVRNIAKKFDFP